MKLQTELEDFRDNRGKEHELAYIVLLFTFAMLRTEKKITIACVHRKMGENHQALLSLISKSSCKLVSYSQLKRILRKISFSNLNEIFCDYLGVKLFVENNEWYAVDGKELRGTIDGVSGEKRGENIISLTNHQSRLFGIIKTYNGKKEAEMTQVAAYFNNQEKIAGKYSLDALHTQTSLLTTIHTKGGIYLTQVKSNQKTLVQDFAGLHGKIQSIFTCNSEEKGHGRIEKRQYFAYKINKDFLDEKWHDCQMCTLIVAERERYNSKTGKKSQETAYWVSNHALKNDADMKELAAAVRNHWAIETVHNIRDKQFGEDNMICRNTNEAKTLAVFISCCVNLLAKHDNLSIIREKLASGNENITNVFDMFFL